MTRKSLVALAAGVVVVFVVTTLVDVVLHAVGVYPPLDQPIDNRLALLATTYRVVIGIYAAWLSARIAPNRPMKHAMILGAIGVALGLVGVVTTWNSGLGPRWYPVALVALAIPQSWAGARIAVSRR
jgi:hypothetical protein